MKSVFTVDIDKLKTRFFFLKFHKFPLKSKVKVSKIGPDFLET
jgi:hypothetical protein